MILIFDMDGVIYRGQERLPGVKEALGTLREMGHTIYFLTNNSSQSRESYRDKLAGMGIPSDTAHIMTSGFATALYLKEQGHSGKKVLVVGGQGLRDEMAAVGMAVVDEPPADFVVVGMDRAFTYMKLLHAQQAILHGAEFLATNCDPTYPLENNRVVPGGGSIVAAVRTASQTEPKVIGKPSPYSFYKILDMESAKPEDAVMIGDRLDTDIQVGNRVGVHTVLVLTGVTTAEEAAAAEGEMRPEKVVANLMELPAYINELKG